MNKYFAVTLTILFLIGVILNDQLEIRNLKKEKSRIEMKLLKKELDILKYKFKIRPKKNYEYKI